MSAIIGAVIGAVILGVLVPAGAKLARRAVKGISKKFDADLGTGDERFARSGETIRPVSKIRSEFKALVPDLGPLASADDAKKVVFSALASSPFYMTDENGFKERIAALERSATIEEVRSAASGISEFLETGNQKVLAEAIRMACERASNRIGFTRFEAIPVPVSSTQVRFAATDALGRTLVTEISAPLDGDVRVDTEVLGVSDDSCHKLLEEFHEALRREGVDIAGPPTRESTGGICTSAAAREFLALKAPVKRMTRNATPGAAARRKQAPKRAIRKDTNNELRTNAS